MSSLGYELAARGYAVLPGAFDAQALAEIRAELDAGFAALPNATSDGWGIALSPLLPRLPRLVRCFDVPQLIAGLGEVLGGEVCLVHTAARWTNFGSEQRLPWHFHEYEGGDGRWDPERSTVKSGFTRLIASLYVDGANSEIGSLWVHPRAIGDSTAPPDLDPDAEWTGQTEVTLAPGSILVHDVALYHRAWRGTGSAPRRILGGVYQRRGDALSDDDSPEPDEQLRRALAAHPAVCELLRR